MILTITQRNNSLWYIFGEDGTLYNMHQTFGDAFQNARRFYEFYYAVKDAGYAPEIRPTPLEKRVNDPLGIDQRVATSIESASGKDLCDFCSNKTPVWDYECPDFLVSRDPMPEPFRGDLVESSRGDWAACEGCAQLIEQKAWDRLVQRCVEVLRKRYPGRPYSDMYQSIDIIHRGFRKHYNEQRQPYVQG